MRLAVGPRWSVLNRRAIPPALALGETLFTFQTFDDSGAKRRGLARVMHGTREELLDNCRAFPPLARVCL